MNEPKTTLTGASLVMLRDMLRAATAWVGPVELECSQEEGDLLIRGTLDDNHVRLVSGTLHAPLATIKGELRIGANARTVKALGLKATDTLTMDGDGYAIKGKGDGTHYLSSPEDGEPFVPESRFVRNGECNPISGYDGPYDCRVHLSAEEMNALVTAMKRTGAEKVRLFHEPEKMQYVIEWDTEDGSTVRWDTEDGNGDAPQLILNASYLSALCIPSKGRCAIEWDSAWNERKVHPPLVRWSCFNEKEDAEVKMRLYIAPVIERPRITEEM